MNILTSPRFKMVLAGGFSLAASYTVFLLLLQLGVYYQFASIVNFCTYLTINFLLNRVWAFKSAGHAGKQAMAHASLHLSNQIIIMIGLYVLVEHLSVSAAIAQIFMQVLVTVAVFTLTPLIFSNKK